MRVYRGASTDEVYGLTFEALEAEWLEMLAGIP